MTGSPTRAIAQAIFKVNSQLETLLTAYNWQETPLGQVEQWSNSLKSALSILCHAPCPMFVLWQCNLDQSQDPQILFYNQAASTLFEIHHEGVAEQPFLHENQANLEQVLTTGKSLKTEPPTPSIENGIEQPTWNYSPIWDETGVVRGVVAIADHAVPLCDRIFPESSPSVQQIEETLQRQQEQLHLITNALPVLIAYIDKQHYYRFNNQTYEAWFGKPAASFTGKHIREVLGENAYQSLRPRIEQALSGQFVSFESELHYGNGIRYIRAEYIPHINHHGEIEGYFSLVSDISDRARLEAERQQAAAAQEQLLQTLSAQRTCFEAVLRQMPEGVIIADAASENIILANEQTYRLLQNACESNANLSDGQPIPTEHPHRQLYLTDQHPLLRSLRHGEIITHEEIKLCYPDGDWRILDVSSSPIIDPQGQITSAVALIQDITERKRTEAALRQSEARFRLMAETIQDVFWITDFQIPRILYVSPAYEQIWGSSPAAIYHDYQAWADSIHPDDRERVMAIAATNQNEEIVEQEYQIIRPDGTVRWIRDRGFAVRDEDGDIQQVVGIAQDITHQKQTEIALRQSEEQARLATKIGRLGTWRYDTTTHLVQLDERMCQIWGESPETTALTLPQVLTRIHPDDQERVSATINAALNPTSSGLYEIDYRIVWPDGTERWILANGQVQFAQEGASRRAIGFCGTALDITERKHNEAALRRSEERLRLAMEGAQMGTWDVDLITGKAIWSEQHFRMLGYAPNATLEGSETRWAERIHPDDAESVALEWKSAGLQKRLYRAEYRIIRADNGQVRWLAGIGSFIYNAAQQPVRSIGVLFDITERKHDEEALRRSEERFRISQELSLDAFTILDAVRDETGMIVDFVWRYVNPAAAHILQRPVDELVGQHLLKILPGNQINSELFTRYVNVVETGEAHDLELSYDADGIIGWFRNMAVKLEDGVAVSFSDISGRKRTELEIRSLNQELARRIDELQALFELLPIGVAIAEDSQCLTIRANPALAQMLRIPINANASQTAPSQERPLYRMHRDGQEIPPEALPMQFSARFNTEVRDETFDIVHPDGSVIQLLCYASPLRDEQGNVRGSIGGFVDITRRTLTEAALRESEARFRGVVESNMVGIFFWDSSGLILDGNEMAVQMLGYSREELRSGQVRWQEITPPEFYDLDRSVTATILRDGSCTPFEKAYIRKDGTQVPILLGAALLPGYKDRGVAYFIDITERKRVEAERKQAQAALAANEARLRGFVESNVVGILYGDIYGNIHAANDELLRIIGYSRAELEQGLVRWIDITPPEYLPLDEVAIAEAREKGACTPYEKVYLHKDGTPVPVLVGYSLVGEAREESVAFILDLSASKQVEVEREQLLRQLEASVEQLEAIINNMTEGLIIADGEGQVLTFNPAALALHDYQQVEEVQKPLEELTDIFAVQDLEGNQVPSEQWPVSRVLNGETYSNYELQVCRCETGKTWIGNYGGTSVRDKDGKIRLAVVTVRDVTAQRQAQAELARSLADQQAARAEAEAANRIKDEFLAVLSHELRSPLNPILGWSNLLQKRQFDPAATKQALQTIERNAKLQAQLIEDLLDVSRILQGKLILNVGPVPLGLMIQSALETVRLAAEAKQIEIRTQLEPGKLQASGDAARLQQIIWNLLSNAVKFTPDRGVIEVSLKRVDTYAQIQVKDTGKGINPDFLPFVFDYFRQEDGKTTRKFGGLGLGLAIVRHLTELHGGTIWADSPGEGLGATFTLKLPLMKGLIATTALPEALPQQFDLSQLRVLIVDDEADMRALLQVILEQYQAQVMVATSALEALQLFEQHPPDLLISDIGMPEMDGYTLIRQIRSLAPELGGQVPAIALTAYAGEYDQQQALNAGFQTHLAKPIEVELCLKAIASLVNR